MRFYGWLLLASLPVAGAGCGQAQPPPGSPDLLSPATIKDIMDSMVNPSGEFLFESVQVISDEQGVREKAPQTDADWEAVRQRVVVLMEAPNLLVMPGRKVAPADV